MHRETLARRLTNSRVLTSLGTKFSYKDIRRSRLNAHRIRILYFSF
jgi:hypothetical protein